MSALTIDIALIITVGIAVAITAPWVWLMRKSIITNSNREREDVAGLRALLAQRQRAYEELAARHFDLERRMEGVERQALRVTALEEEVTSLRDENIKLSRQLRVLQEQLKAAQDYNEHLQSKLTARGGAS